MPPHHSLYLSPSHNQNPNPNLLLLSLPHQSIPQTPPPLSPRPRPTTAAHAGMQPPVALPPDCCHHIALAPECRHRRAPTSRTCHSREAMTPTATSSSSCLHRTSIFCNSRPQSCHHRATIAAPYSRSSMLPRVRTACSFLHVAGNHQCCCTSESCSSQRELCWRRSRTTIEAMETTTSSPWKPPRVRACTCALISLTSELRRPRSLLRRRQRHRFNGSHRDNHHNLA